MLQLTTILFLISFSMLSALNYLAIKLFLYWRLWWFDIPMHLFGGAVVALGIFTLRDLRLIPNGWTELKPVLGIVVLVAVIWEAFELYAGIPIVDPYYIDTVTDVVMGIVGSYIGYTVGSRLHNL